MARKRHTAEQIIHKLREAEVALGQGKTVKEVCRQLEVTEQTLINLGDGHADGLRSVRELGPSIVIDDFGANAVANAGIVYLNGSTFNGTADLECTDGNFSSSAGGNTFNSTTTIENSGAVGPFRLAGTNPDIFNGDVTLTSSGNGIQAAV